MNSIRESDSPEMFELFLYYLTAFGLGAAHALEPGHGKTLVAAYLTGTRGNIRDAVLLGLLVTVFHTLSVFLLGITGVFLLKSLLNEQEALFQSLEILSGVIIFGIGTLVFWRRFVLDKSPNECECHIHHTHDPDQRKPIPKDIHSLKEVIGLGLASGISPCPIALGALIASITIGGFQKLPEALIYLMIFSMGLGMVLVVIGLTLVYSRDSVAAFLKKDSPWPVWMSRISTFLLIALGLYLIAKGVLGYPHG